MDCFIETSAEVVNLSRGSVQIVAHIRKVLVVSTDTPRAPLDPSILSSHLSQYWRVKVVDVTGSTQDDLAVAVTIGDAQHGDVLATEFQSKGRGRLGRTFEAAPHSALMFSLFITPQRDTSYWSFLPLLSGLAVQRALHELDNTVTIDVKWPNDLFIGDKKIAGLIAQTAGKGVVIGIGINVGMNESELPVPIATSLGIHGFAVQDRNIILPTILRHFQELFTQWDAGQDFVDQYSAVSSTIASHVQATLPDGVVKEGRATHIDHHGGLILDDGTMITVGDIVHLR